MPGSAAAVGGIRRSGYGRELSHFGLRELTNPQTVWIVPALDEPRPGEHRPGTVALPA